MDALIERLLDSHHILGARVGTGLGPLTSELESVTERRPSKVELVQQL